jgi:hypothetical protein
MTGDPILTLDAIRHAAAQAELNQAGQTGRKVLFPDKRPGLVYLTPWTKARLVTLAKNANVSQADFLEVLIRRYGLAAGSDILEALGDEDGTEPSTVGDAAPVPDRRS